MVRPVDGHRWFENVPSPERDPARSERAADERRRGDVVSISRDARASAERMARLRARIESGYYLRPEVQAVVAERIAASLLD